MELEKKQGRAVLVTGATGGIGQAIALRFAREGWDVLCHYFTSEEKVKRLRDEITSYQVDCSIFRADFTRRAQVQRLLSTLEDYDIDSLVNNAGTYVSSRHFTELTFDDLLRTFMLNTMAATMLSARLFPRMMERKFGRIVNISSVAAKYGGSSRSMHYGCSKRALEGVTKTLAKEGATHNVLVNTVRPGVIDTQFHRKFLKDMGRRIAMIPMKKMGAPEDVADVAYFLGSEMNNYITGQSVAVSGGE